MIEPLDRRRWRRAVSLFERAAALRPELREEFLLRETAGDVELARVVRRLLRGDSIPRTALDEGVGWMALSALDPFAEEPALQPGRRIGDFEILREIGRGGMGIVYEALDVRLDRRVALKLLTRGFGADDGDASRLLGEARAASALDHPNIETVYQVGESADGVAFIAMARYEGETLRERLARGPLRPAAALDIGIQVARGLAAAHRAGIVHRDVKPENVFLTRSGPIKLLDFGIAAVRGKGSGATAGRGTASYMSPERVRGEPPSPSSDIWSLGILLFEMLSGRPPVSESTTAATLARIGDGEPLPALPSGGRYGRHVARVVAGALEKDVRLRYADAGVILSALEACRERATRRSRRRTGIAVITFLVLAALSARWMGTRRPSAAPVARRMYEEGLRAYYDGDHASAARMFEAALAEDSTFVMAGLYDWLSSRDVPGHTAKTSLARVLRMSATSPDFERLRVRATQARAGWRRSLSLFADSLAERFPLRPDGPYLEGVATARDGRFAEAVPFFRRAIALDSLGLEGVEPECRACDAMRSLAETYFELDSLPAADRTLREYLRWRPRSASAWMSLAYALEARGRVDSALAAWTSLTRVAPGHAYGGIYAAREDLRLGRWAEADAQFRELERNGPPDVQDEARWFLAISLREQGRLREARDVEHERFLRSLRDLGSPHSPGSLLEAQLLTESGRGWEADSLLARRARILERTRRHDIRDLTWAMAHRVTALAAVGDTATLRRLADTLQRVGARSGYVRDRRLYHYARGVLLARGGHYARAELELRRSIVSPLLGFSRINLELGRVLLALDRPLEAVEVFRAPLPGPLESQHLYVSRTELHEALGRAFDAAGWADSAAAHYRWVAEAWSGADPPLQPRRESVLARLEALRQSTGSGDEQGLRARSDASPADATED